MGKSSISVNIPDFYTDPYFTKTQDYLYGFGTDILQGKLPDFYSGLGQTGSKQFQDMLALVNKNTATAVNENLVRRNISRGGVGLSTIAKQTAETSTTLNWQDYLRAMTEKGSLLTTGLSTVSGVGEKALSYGGQENQYNLSKAQLELQQAQANAQTKAQEDAMWGQIISSAIGAAGMFATGGLSGLGSAATTGQAGGVSKIAGNSFAMQGLSFG